MRHRPYGLRWRGADGTPTNVSRGLQTFGPIGIVSAHPDDETLGCGGLIAACGDVGVPVLVVTLTDGMAFDGRTNNFSNDDILLRRVEQMTVLGALNDGPLELTHLSLPFGELDTLSAAKRNSVLLALWSLLNDHRCRSVFVSAPDGGHTDHRVAYELVRALPKLRQSCDGYTYGGCHNAADSEAYGYDAWQLAYPSMVSRKRSALRYYGSQRRAAVNDDGRNTEPPKAVLDRALAPWELFQSSHTL